MDRKDNCVKDGAGSKPLTRDPKRPAFDSVTRPSKCLCFGLRDDFDVSVLLVLNASAKTLWSVQHTYRMTKMADVIVDLLSIEK